MTDETEGRRERPAAVERAPEPEPEVAPMPAKQDSDTPPSRAVTEHKARLEEMDKTRGF